MNKYSLDMEKYKALARQASAEGCVLLKNDNNTLPINKGEKAAVFGRMAREYYKSGLGSGGLVNTEYTIGILDALEAEDGIEICRPLNAYYDEFLIANPHDKGEGWGRVPWCQKEMPVTDEMLDAAADSDIAIVVIGRTAGEDQDNKNAEGSYLLNETERDLIKKVSARFARTAVLLNVGNIIDMKWVDEYNPSAVMYVWQGGQEGGNGVCDALTGKVSPSGKLTDTIAYNIEDYPSDANFGDSVKNYYEEDIYVGYRYFETFSKDKVLYPFGFGLSYTCFDIKAELAGLDADSVSVSVTVTNTGEAKGKEVAQVYVKAPQGLLGKPEKVLADFCKTKELEPGESETLSIVIPKYAYASYDDSGVTGNKSCYVLEEGTYELYAGSDVRSAEMFASLDEKFTVVDKLTEAYAPAEEFKRMHPVKTDNGYEVSYEAASLRTVDPKDRVSQYPAEIPYTGDKGIKLADVYSGKNTMDEFVAQLSDENLIHMFRGEGMCSPKVTPGTGAAFGGLTEELRAFGIPAACCSDGPSGIRLDVGATAFSLPNGACIGCSFNKELTEELYGMLGRELRKNRIDALLGPGLNIHRHPLNGRNFEYISEDPIVTGKIGAAMVRGLNVVGSTGTIKHFCGNNQEHSRRKAEGVISERALREIYLKVFEIAVKEGNARSVMTTYGPVNGLWTAGSYDLCTTVLRNEWGYDGFVMTDWWAESNREGEDSAMTCRAPMVAAQNDVYMVCENAMEDSQDDVVKSLASGEITRAQLQRNAKNILGFILKSPAMLYEMDLIEQDELDEIKASLESNEIPENLIYYSAEDGSEIVIDCEEFKKGVKGNIIFGIHVPKFGVYDFEITAHSNLDKLAQLPITIFYDNAPKFTAAFRGTNGEKATIVENLGPVFGNYHYIKLYVGADGIFIDGIKIVFKADFKFH